MLAAAGIGGHGDRFVIGAEDDDARIAQRQDATQARLDRGYRMVEVLKQGQYQPMHVTDQVLVIYAGTRGHLDKIPAKEVPAWEKQFLTFIHDQKPEIVEKIDKTKDLDDEGMKAITSAIGEFQNQYASQREKTVRA